MSLVIRNLEIEKKKLLDIYNDLTIRINTTFKKEEHKVYFSKEEIANDKLSVSLVFPVIDWKKYYSSFPDRKDVKNVNFTTTIKLITSDNDIDFEGQRDQNIVVDEAYKNLLEKRVQLLNLSTGFGKTKTAIVLASMLKKRVLWICPYTIPNEKTAEDFKKFTTAKVILVENEFDEKLDYDVFIMGAIKAEKLSIKELSSFGTVILDECHAYPELVYTKLLLKLRPSYLIGLSATPDKGGDFLIKYFGPESNYIYRMVKKTFTVHKYNTGIKLDTKYTIINGKRTVDYGFLTEQVELNYKRSNVIAQIAENELSEYRIILLVNRIQIARDIYDSFENKDDVELFLETTKLKDLKGKKYLIAQRLKAGVGFDDEGLNIDGLRYNCLIVTFDTSDIRQNEGRIRENKNLIVEFVDSHFVFEKHWAIRKKWYIKRGCNKLIETTIKINDDE